MYRVTVTFAGTLSPGPGPLTFGLFQTEYRAMAEWMALLLQQGYASSGYYGAVRIVDDNGVVFRSYTFGNPG